MNAPVALAGRRRAGILNAMQQGLTQTAPPRISIKAQKFTLVDGAGVQIPVQLHEPHYGLYLDVVIIGVNPSKSKIYYEYEYDPGKDEPPTCFSDNGIGASAQATTPQNPQGGYLCATCPQNVWGSDTSKMTGKPTKACSDRKKLAVIVVNDPSQLVYQLQVPPASLKNLAVLATALKSHQVTDAEGQRPADPADVVTRIYFNPQKQGELLFQPTGFHQQVAPYVMDLIDKADASGVIDTATGVSDVPYSGGGAPQIAPQPAPQALPAPTPQFQAPPPAPFVPAAAPQTAPPASPQFPSPSAMQPQPGIHTQPPNGGATSASPSEPPRTRRGGARAGAGRPRPAEQPGPAPTAAPFQQQPPAPQVPQNVPMTPAQVNAVGGAPFTPPQQGDPNPMPAFLQRPAPATPAPQAPAFGMTNGAQPDPGLQSAIAAAFGAPLQPRPRG